MRAVRRTRFLLLAVVAAGLRAEPPAASATPPPEDAINAAKRDYDLIKGAKSSSLDPQRMDLPRMEAPAMHLSSDEMAVFLESEAAQKKKAKDPKKGNSGNWLVDAMAEKKPDSRDGPKPEAVSALEDEPAASLAGEVKTLPRDEAKSNPALAKQAPAAADNPLTTYMSAWMTPKDLELLKAKPEDPGLGAAPDKGPGGSAETGMLDGLVRSDNGLSPGNAAAAGLSSAERRPNPYLAEFAPDAASLAGMKELPGLPAPNGPGTAPAASVLVPVPNDPGPAKTEAAPLDLLKPPADAKYFPQLKRF